MLQYSTAVRIAALTAMISSVGASPIMKFFSGAQPANCGAADPSGPLASFTLPNTWLNTPTASGDIVTATQAGGPWTTTASAAGTAVCYRIYDSTGTTCHHQGAISTIAAGTGDIQLTNNVLAASQSISVSTYTITTGNS